MGEIYKKATEAFIWLGESDDEVDAAINAIPVLNDKLSSFDGRLPTIRSGDIIVHAGLPSFTFLVGRGFGKLYSRP
jgi:hypothetical protein